MKKNFFMLAATAALFAACAETELVNEVNIESNSQEIGFSTYAGKVTRAENNPTAYTWDLEEHHVDFTVFAGKMIGNNGAEGAGTQAVYSNENPGTVTCNGGVWTADPLKYWDKTASKYYFYAGAPADEKWEFAMDVPENDYTTGYLTYAGFKLNGENLANGTDTHYNHWAVSHAVNDIDLMIASPCPVDRAAYNKAAADDVNLQFNHILSRLSIKVKKGENIADIHDLELNSLVVYNMKNVGDFDEHLFAVTNNTPSIARWSNWNVDGTYTLSQGTAVNQVITEEAVYTHQYLVIPQKVNYESIDTNGSSANSQAYFRIDYTIDDEAYYAYYNLADAFGKKVFLDFNEGWENTLTITINPAVIEFDAEVSEWANDTVKDQEIN